MSAKTEALADLQAAGVALVAARAARYAAAEESDAEYAEACQRFDDADRAWHAADLAYCTAKDV